MVALIPLVNETSILTSDALTAKGSRCVCTCMYVHKCVCVRVCVCELSIIDLLIDWAHNLCIMHTL